MQEIIEGFVFLAPLSPSTGGSHCNRINNVLQLNVETFCLDICSAVDDWVFNNRENNKIQEATSKMLEINLSGVTLFGGIVRIE